MGSVFADFPRLMGALHVEPRHLIHVGAHKGEEVQFYKEAGVERITLVEPIPELAESLATAYSDDAGVQVINVACGPAPMVATLSVMQKTNLSTLLEPQRHDLLDHTIQVPVVQLRSIQRDANIAVIDAQGLELEVLSETDFEHLDLLIVECCTVDDPTIAVGYDALVEFMDGKGYIEKSKWSRDYQWINRWSRGFKSRFNRSQGSVLDVAFMREDYA